MHMFHKARLIFFLGRTKVTGMTCSNQLVTLLTHNDQLPVYQFQLYLQQVLSHKNRCLISNESVS